MDGKDILILCLAAGGVYIGGKYYSAYNLVQKLKFSLAEFSYDQQNRDSITLAFYINVQNPTNTSITVKNSSLNCYLNSSYAGKCFIPYTQVIQAQTTTKILIATTIYYKNIFSQWWQLFLQAATSVHLTIAGSIRFNGVMIPIPALTVAEFNLQNAIKAINN